MMSDLIVANLTKGFRDLGSVSFTAKRWQDVLHSRWLYPDVAARIRWIVHRHSSQAAGTVETPRGIPVLTTGVQPGMGNIGFLRAVRDGGDPVPTWQGAAAAVASWARAAGLDPGALGFDTRDLPAGTWGDSGGLSAVLAALQTLLGLPWPDQARIACTGCLDYSGPHLRLVPVEGSTLAAKSAVAHAWGYTHLAVVEGQTGLDAVRTAGLTPMVVPTDPATAALIILGHLYGDLGGDHAIELLTLHDRGAMHLPWSARALALTPFLDHADDLVRAVAHDSLARAALHQGASGVAAHHHGCAVTLLRAARDAGRWPHHAIGDFLEWHLPAHGAIVALDTGTWNPQDTAWQAVDQAIAALDAAGLHRSERAYAALALRNARARRIDCQARLDRDPAALIASWADRTALVARWPRIMDYARHLGLAETSLARQHNECQDVLASFHALTGHLPTSGDWPDMPDWTTLGLWFAHHPDLRAAPVIMPDGRVSAYHLAYALRWRAITGVAVSADDLVWALAAVGDRHGWPWLLVPETIIRYRLGDDALCQTAARHLAADPLIFPASSVGEATVLAAIARRVHALLADLGVTPAHPPVLPLGDGLCRLVSDLERDPGQVVVRCPY